MAENEGLSNVVSKTSLSIHYLRSRGIVYPCSLRNQIVCLWLHNFLGLWLWHIFLDMRIDFFIVSSAFALYARCYQRLKFLLSSTFDLLWHSISAPNFICLFFCQNLNLILLVAGLSGCVCTRICSWYLIMLLPSCFNMVLVKKGRRRAVFENHTQWRAE
jgi:hypothetical protein